MASGKIKQRPGFADKGGWFGEEVPWLVQMGRAEAEFGSRMIRGLLGRKPKPKKKPDYSDFPYAQEIHRDVKEATYIPSLKRKRRRGMYQGFMGPKRKTE